MKPRATLMLLAARLWFAHHINAKLLPSDDAINLPGLDAATGHQICLFAELVEEVVQGVDLQRGVL